MIVNAHKFREKFAAGQKQMFTGITITDPAIAAHMSADELAEHFDLGYHTRHVETIFARVFGED